MRSKYIIIVLSALTLGFGVAFWRATDEIDLQMQAAHMAAMAERSAQEKQLLESKARETAEQAHEKAANRAAEVAQKFAEQINATNALSEKLVLEGKARETAEQAHVKAANRAAEAGQK